ncbi:hypothetical protein ILUMI_00013 [Ignelater luminosus]|uniref:Uncharacterized protein n=1 Tax=Ignelater luminosus TaxID=2038154 RepID=A0A8K0DH17_IGNLU|nr:hypothetical protein ILUMI_00013 [Ignelater luminosus]
MPPGSVQPESPSETASKPLALSPPSHNARRVFDEAEESNLKDYLKKAADIYCELTPKEAANLTAGPDWFSGFPKRSPCLSIRTPQATSLSRATSLNKTNVDILFQNLSVLRNDVYNMEETGMTTVQRPYRIVA